MNSVEQRSGGPHVQLSDLDFERFGVRTVKAELLAADQVAECIESASVLKAELMIVRMKTEALDVVQALEARGARLMDSLIYYRRRVDVTPHELIRNGYRYRFSEAADSQNVSKLARQTFNGYQGHYHADPRLPNDKCDEVYESWAERSCVVQSVADRVILCESTETGELAAFATLKCDKAQRSLEGVLFGVSPKHQGRGIYRHLIRSMHAVASELELREMIVSTQITNMTVQRSWTKEGFEPYASTYTLHLWLDN